MEIANKIKEFYPWLILKVAFSKIIKGFTPLVLKYQHHDINAIAVNTIDIIFMMHKKYGKVEQEKQPQNTLSTEELNEVMFEDPLCEVKTTEEMKEQLHKHIGVLHFKKRGNFTMGNGTAFLISSNLVLTAAHNLVENRTGSIFHDIVFYPGHQGTIKRENAYEV